jgi:hypothetical protein
MDLILRKAYLSNLKSVYKIGETDYQNTVSSIGNKTKALKIQAIFYYNTKIIKSSSLRNSRNASLVIRDFVNLSPVSICRKQT